ncbi:MAG: hypothetical protein WC043_01770 [Pseudobdellovibrionaceae bacterium]
MSIENIYSYIEYLNFAVDQLEDAVNVRVEENNQLRQSLAEMQVMTHTLGESLDRADARAQLAEGQLQNRQDIVIAQTKQISSLQAQLQDLTKRLADVPAPALAASQVKAKAAEPQDDLFGNWTAGTPQPKAKVANDQNALLLAKKLDSTIDKVQRLIAAQGK